MAENQKMEIDLGEDVAQGNYINLAIIAHSVSEFIIDFAWGKSKYRLRSAILPAIFRWAEVPRSVRLKVRYFRSAGAGRAVVLPKP